MSSVNGITTKTLAYSATGQLLAEDASSIALNYYNQLRLGYDSAGRLTTISNALLNYGVVLGWAGKPPLWKWTLVMHAIVFIAAGIIVGMHLHRDHFAF